MQHEQFAIAVRFWKIDEQQPPDIICACRRCLNFIVSRDTYSLHQWIRMHLSQPCPAALAPSDLPDIIEKAVADRMENETPKLAPQQAAVEWILRDASCKSPEQIGAVGDRWLDKLREAFPELQIERQS